MEAGSRKQNNKAIISMAVALAVLVAAALLLAQNNREKPLAGAKTIQVSILVDGAEAENHEIHTDAAFLREALEKETLIGGTEGQFGLFVDTVAGRKADESRQEWWSFTKAGEMLLTGVDETPVADGDRFEITLVEGY